MRIFFSSDSVPFGIDWRGVEGVVISGRLEVISAASTGINSQSALLVALTEKYGKPIEDKNRAVSNRYGATFEVKKAKWLLADGSHITLDGATYKIDRGNVTIATPVGAKFLDDEDTQDEAKRAKF